MKGGRNMEMTESQTVKLIEWLKANGHNDEQVVQCLAYINGAKSK